MLAATGVLLTVAMTVGIVSGYLLASHRVRQAADLAALSGGQRLADGESGCATAEATARAQGARITRCVEVGDALEFALTVEARLPVIPWLPGLPDEVSATASAGRLLA